MTFKGFKEGPVQLTPVPDPFFTELLPQIDHLGELKVSIYAFYRLHRMEGAFRYLRHANFLEDAGFMQAMGANPQEAQEALYGALERCVQRGTLLRANLELEGNDESFYFLNSSKGRAAVAAILREEWRPTRDKLAPIDVIPTRPNIFRLYEENIGPLTPMISESLQDAEQAHPASWIEEAIQIAVENNVRRWSYVEAILERWKDEGRHGRKDRQAAEEDRRKYVEGEFSDYIEH